MRLFASKKPKDFDVDAVGYETWATMAVPSSSAAPNTKKFNPNTAVSTILAEPIDERMSTRVKLSIKCANLPNVDGLMSKTDSFVVVTEGLREIGRTEIVSNCLDPEFVTSVYTIYFFEQKQALMFYIYQAEDNSKPGDISGIELNMNKSIGFEFCLLSDIMNAPNRQLSLDAKSARGKPRIQVIGEEVDVFAETQLVFLGLSARDLDKKDLFGKSNPFFRIYRQHETQSGVGEIVSYKSEVVMQELSPQWCSVDLRLAALGGDPVSPFRISVYDWNRNGKHDLIGSVRTSINALRSAHERRTKMDLEYERKDGSKKISGSLYVHQFAMMSAECLPAVMGSGIPLPSAPKVNGRFSFMLAVDFSSSNGNEDDKNSLHYVMANKNGHFNPYQKCILALDSLFRSCDSDSEIPCFGFGASSAYQKPEKNPHCFPINRNYSRPELSGVQQILETYKSILEVMRPCEPSLFTEVIIMAASKARHKREDVNGEPTHQVLLILTDGKLDRFQKTTNVLIQSSELPLSVIVIGIGTGDFTLMDQLSNLDFAGRQMVHFVPFRQYVFNDGSVNQSGFTRALTEKAESQKKAYSKGRGFLK